MHSNADWIEDWNNGKIGFHMQKLNPMLEKHADKLLTDQSNCRIFVPLCGKTVDMKWLADLGHTVVGVDVAKVALLSFFEEQHLDYTIGEVVEIPGASVYKSKDNRIVLYEADLFSLNKSIIGQFDCIWDRSSLIAINKEDRKKYVSTLISLMAPDCRYILSVYDYDSTKATGPPFDVPNSQVFELYEPTCTVEKIDVADYRPKKFSSDVTCIQTLFLIKPK